jgi:L-lactate permease
MWDQIYDPLNSKFLSTCAAALPVVTLLVLIASNKVKAHIAALVALVVANFIAIVVFTMPADMSLRATVLGAVTGFFPIGWIVLNVIFLYRLTVEKGVFQTLQTTIGGVTEDRRLQLLLIAFSFGAFFEGASGFGTPVAVTGAILIGLGFSPLAASGLSLIANTAPVAYGALGTPIAGLASVTDLDPFLLGAMVGRQLPFFSLIVPFWLIWAFAGYRGMKEVWPAILVTGVSFAVPQFLISNFINPWIVDIGASLISMACLIKAYGETIRICAYSLITISAMLAIGTLTRLSGIDATLGLAFAGTGVLYPFFGTLLGWLGMALTGSDTASNILFGNLQKITSQQLGLPPILMAAANSSGGVMGKMIDAQSIVVASTATNWFGHEGTILRFVFKHSIALACLVGVLVMLQAYVFTGMIVK